MGLFKRESRKELMAHIDIKTQREEDLLKDLAKLRSERTRYKGKLDVIRDLLRKYKLVAIEQNKMGKELYVCEIALDKSLSTYLFDFFYRTGNPSYGIESTICMDHESYSRYVFIEDIRVQNINTGEGSIAMEYFLKTAKSLGFIKVVGELSPVDNNHFDRLEHFYNKFGFTVTFDENRTSGRIEKRLC